LRGLGIYPLGNAENPPEMELISIAKVPFNTVHEDDFEFDKTWRPTELPLAQNKSPFPFREFQTTLQI
jgi:hypothetical protein